MSLGWEWGGGGGRAVRLSSSFKCAQQAVMESSCMYSLWFLNRCPLNLDSAHPSPPHTHTHTLLHSPVTGHSATAPAWGVKWMAASGEHLRRDSGWAAFHHRTPRHRCHMRHQGRVWSGGMGDVWGRREGRWQRFWHVGAVMEWDSKPAATNRFLMRCPIKKAGRWTLMTTVQLVCSFIPPFSITLHWGDGWHVWEHSNWVFFFLPSHIWMLFSFPFP